MVAVPTSYSSALIESLRGASPAGRSAPGVSLLVNPEVAAAQMFTPPAARPNLLNRPAVLSMPVSPPAVPGDSGFSDGLVGEPGMMPEPPPVFEPPMTFDPPALDPILDVQEPAPMDPILDVQEQIPADDLFTPPDPADVYIPPVDLGPGDLFTPPDPADVFIPPVDLGPGELFTPPDPATVPLPPVPPIEVAPEEVRDYTQDLWPAVEPVVAPAPPPVEPVAPAPAPVPAEPIEVSIPEYIDDLWPAVEPEPFIPDYTQDLWPADVPIPEITLEDLLAMESWV